MSENHSADDLTIEELEELLAAKRRARGLERFRRVASEQGPLRGSFDGATSPSRPLSEESALHGSRERARAQGSRWASGPGGTSAVPSAGGEGVTFGAVKITPRTGRLERSLSLLARVNAAFWRKVFPRLRDRLLLLLELGALAGLILVVFSSLSELRVLNREVAEALDSEQVVAPLAHTVGVLPGSSLPPGSEGGVPDPYLHLVEPGASIPIPTPGPRQASRIVIPAIEVDAPVVEGDGWEELKMGTGHRVGSANPGERSNMVISGHNDVYGEIFRYLENVSIGDEVIVYAGDTPYTYLVVAKMVVDPTEVSLLAPTPNATLTLITCHPYMIDTHRLVVIAELANQ